MMQELSYTFSAWNRVNAVLEELEVEFHAFNVEIRDEVAEFLRMSRKMLPAANSLQPLETRGGEPSGYTSVLMWHSKLCEPPACESKISDVLCSKWWWRAGWPKAFD